MVVWYIVAFVAGMITGFSLLALMVAVQRNEEQEKADFERWLHEEYEKTKKGSVDKGE